MITINDIEIHPIKHSDAWKVCNFIVANEDRLKPYFPKTVEQNLNPTLSGYFAEKKVKAFENKDEFLFTLKQKESRTLVGLVYIKDVDWSLKQGEFAYCIGYPFEGKGIIQNAIKALSAYAFETLELKTLRIIVHDSNIASIKVATKNSFKWVKTLPNEYTPPGGKPLDMELYELYNER
ncbi:MAG: GNAT family protein [Bacteroidota bacterium]